MSARSLVQKCCCPVYADILKQRSSALLVAGFGVAQLVGSIFGLGLPCPFHALTGLPCPGCGLTRSVLALLDGHARNSVSLHPFGPLLLLGLIVALAAGALPGHSRGRLLEWVAVFESRTGFTAIALTLLMILWGLRVFGLLPLTVV